MGDGATSTDADPSHIYDQPGSYTIGLTVSSPHDSDTFTRTNYINVADVTITSLVAENDGPTTLGDTTSFTATITEGTNVIYSWDFGDGQSGTGATPNHTYASIGTYTAEVTATNGAGSQTAQTTVQVVDVPIAGLSAGSDSPTQVGNITTFQATTTAGSNISYSWDFGDGASGSGATPSHTYAAVGSYTVEVTATNGAGSSTEPTTVQVVDVPIAGLSAGSNSPTQVGSATTFQATTTAGSNISYSWDFGDGASGSGATPNHTYASIGTYTAEVTATNGAGSQTAQTTVQVVDVPIAGLSAGSDSPTQVGNITTFQATTTAGSNISYSWDFGDGASGSGATPSHTYAAVGSYTVEVTATNGAGSSTEPTTVQVVDVPIAGLSAGSDSPTQVGSITTFQATTTAGSNISYSWDFGDGASGSGATPSHTYAAVDKYTARVTATNGVGSQTAETTVQVADGPLASLSAGNDGPTQLGAITTFQASVSSGSNVAYAWDFGDGSTGAGANPSHTYAAVGTYTATATASNGTGSQTTTTVVQIVDVPIAGLIATNDGPTELGNATEYVASVSAGTNVAYSWDFGDGNGGAGATLSHIYAASGMYTATVTAANGQGTTVFSTVVHVGHRSVSIDGSTEATLVHADPVSGTIEVRLPVGAVDETTELLLTDIPTPTESPPGFAFAGRAFTLEAFQDGLPMGGFLFDQPVTLKIEYSDTDLNGLDETKMALLYWNGTGWEDAACGAYDRHPAENWLAVAICHLSRFALYAEPTDDVPNRIFLPVIQGPGSAVN